MNLRETFYQQVIQHREKDLLETKVFECKVLFRHNKDYCMKEDLFNQHKIKEF